MPDALSRRGRCHVFGDGIPLDEGLIPFDMAIRRIDDPAVLIPELFRQIDAGFASRVQRGDLVIAGRDFCCGKPHLQGFIAMAALGLAVICTSMPYKAMRGAISKGVPVLTGLDDPAGGFSTDDEVEVDFAAGRIVNLSRGQHHVAQAMSPTLIGMVVEGGTRGMLAAWLRTHPEMSTPLLPSSC